MKIYKLRFDCTSFHDIVVEADNEEDAKNKAHTIAQCPQNGLEFAEFLEVEEDDVPDN